MMKRTKGRIYILITLLLALMNIFVIDSYAVGPMPEKIKIGLYFEKTGVSGVNIGSQTGFQIGYEQEGNFIRLMHELPDKNLVVRKDAYFTAGGAEYWPQSNIPGGKKYGPYHIQIGKDHSDYEGAKTQIASLAQKGIKAFPAFYNGAFKVWTGLYVSQNEADKALREVKKKSGESCSVIPPGAARVQVLSADNQEVQCIFDSTSDYLIIHPVQVEGKPPLIDINGTVYRGAVEFKRLSDSDMTVINVVDFEEYLYGVLPKEMGGHWPLEALKAQAVSARTYAFLHMDKYKKFGFNLSGCVASQVYAGYKREHERCTKAVEETRGQILTYEGEPAYTYYFSASGGHTEDVRNVWGGSGKPYLQGVEDQYENLEEAYRGIWELEMTPEKVAQIIKAQGYDLGSILSVKPVAYSEAGKVIKLKIVGTKGEKVFERQMTRNVFGANFFNSQHYTVSTDSDIYVMGQNADDKVLTTVSEVKVLSGAGVTSFKPSSGRVYTKGAGAKKSYGVVPDLYRFNGKGWGHGVGMSQWGARGMAESGFTYDQILTHYFPGTKVERD